MLLAYRDAPGFADDGEATDAMVTPSGAPVVLSESFVPARYGARDSRLSLIVIVLAHAVLLFALIKLDVVHLARKAPPPILIELKPLDAPPPPRAIEKPEQTPKVETPIVAPPPIVAIPLSPPPIAAAPVAPPPPPQPAPAADPAPPAPIVPPDVSAENLGNVPPRYPVESRRRHEEGIVRLRVVVSAGGNVDDISLAKSSGFARLDQAALDAVRRWRFRPGTQGGKPVQAVGYLSIPFALTK